MISQTSYKDIDNDEYGGKNSNWNRKEVIVIIVDKTMKAGISI